MDLKQKIINYLRVHPRSKARVIARAIIETKKIVNRCLYAYENIDFEVDDLYRWSTIERFNAVVIPKVSKVPITSPQHKETPPVLSKTKSTSELFADIRELLQTAEFESDSSNYNENESRKNLDQYQMDFVQSTYENIRLLAPAGSGKTLSIIHRCKYLYDKSIDKKVKFLIITFTNSARDSLVRTIDKYPEFVAMKENMTIKTLNSWGTEILSGFGIQPSKNLNLSAIAYALRSDFKVLISQYPLIKIAMDNFYQKPSDRIAEIISDLKGLGFDHLKDKTYEKFLKKYNFLNDEAEVSRLESIYSELVSLKIIEDDLDEEEGIREFYDNFYLFWLKVVQKLFDESIITYEDQKYWALKKMQSNPDDVNLRMRRYDHLIIDEFQDINPLDADLLLAIADRYKTSMTIVGDDDQAIFEWRGATPYYILNPDAVFNRKFKTYILEINYRCPSNITMHAKKLIEHNVKRVKKQIKSSNNNLATIKHITIEEPSERYKHVVELVKKHVEKGNTITLVSRLRKQLLPYQVLFAGENIIFQTEENLNFIDNANFKDLEKIIRMSFNERIKNPLEGFMLILDYVKKHKLGKEDSTDVNRFLSRYRANTVYEYLEVFRSYTGTVKGKPSDEFYLLIEGLFECDTLAGKIDYLSSEFKGFNKDSTKANDSVFFTGAPIAELRDLAVIYPNYEEYFSILASSSKKAKKSQEEKEETYVHMNTGQRVKGKEFEVVIILEVTDDMWPLSKKNIEQERRLFYVAITRTMKYLYLVNGNGEQSRFLEEADFEA